MRIADTDFILIPGWLADEAAPQPRHASTDDDHWISRWQRSIASAQWLKRDPQPASDSLVAQTAALVRPTVIVTHGHGIDVLLEACDKLEEGAITGAFIVAPTAAGNAIQSSDADALTLRFPSVLIAPDNNPALTVSAAQNLASSLGSHYVSAGTVGQLDAGSGHGPWPEGLMQLGWFLKRLGAH